MTSTIPEFPGIDPDNELVGLVSRAQDLAHAAVMHLSFGQTGAALAKANALVALIDGEPELEPEDRFDIICVWPADGEVQTREVVIDAPTANVALLMAERDVRVAEDIPDDTHVHTSRLYDGDE